MCVCERHNASTEDSLLFICLCSRHSNSNATHALWHTLRIADYIWKASLDICMRHREGENVDLVEKFYINLNLILVARGKPRVWYTHTVKLARTQTQSHTKYWNEKSLAITERKPPYAFTLWLSPTESFDRSPVSLSVLLLLVLLFDAVAAVVY